MFIVTKVMVMLVINYLQSVLWTDLALGEKWCRPPTLFLSCSVHMVLHVQGIAALPEGRVGHISAHAAIRKQKARHQINLHLPWTARNSQEQPSSLDQVLHRGPVAESRKTGRAEEVKMQSAAAPMLLELGLHGSPGSALVTLEGYAHFGEPHMSAIHHGKSRERSTGGAAVSQPAW